MCVLSLKRTSFINFSIAAGSINSAHAKMIRSIPAAA
jgi:hypothetical protein